MFKFTQSLVDEHRNSKQKIDLFDLLDKEPSDDQDEIQTFDQLKEWANTFEFQKNQTTSQTQANLKKPKIKSNLGLNRKIQSLQIHEPQYSQTQHTLGFQMAGNKFLDVIRQDVKSRSSTNKPKRRASQNYSIQVGLPNFDSSKSPQKAEKDEENNSMKKSSAHSSRSFNGYDLINQYEMRQKLGSGAFSNVYLCIDIHTQKKYAMKILEKKNFRKRLFRKNSMNLAENYIENEIAILKKMQHPYITKLYEVIADEQKQRTYLVLDYCANGFINQNKKQEEKNKEGSSMMDSGTSRYKKLLESECRRYFKQIAQGLNYIHNVVNIAHRDIKPQNILLSDKDQVKISDFGLGTQDIEIASRSGTRNFMPPETFNKIEYSSKKTNTQGGDVWASGITLLIMLTGKNVDVDISGLPLIISNLKDISDDCRDFIKKCLQVDPQKRITSSQMLSHKWIDIMQIPKYEEIVISKEDQEKAIVSRLNKQILQAVTKLNL